MQDLIRQGSGHGYGNQNGYGNGYGDGVSSGTYEMMSHGSGSGESNGIQNARSIGWSVELIEKRTKQFTTKHTSNMANVINKICIIRSYESGVHFGEVLETSDTIHGLSVTLKDSRRVHYWEGAASLSQMALDGIKKGRIAMVLPEIQVENVCEIIPMSDAAIDNMKKQPMWRV